MVVLIKWVMFFSAAGVLSTDNLYVETILMSVLVLLTATVTLLEE